MQGLIVYMICSLFLFPNFSTQIFLVNADCGSGIIDSGVSPVEAQEAVDKHNALRTSISEGEVKGQPKGVNLQRMQWDENLAIAAQNIANTCEFQHVRVDDPRFQVGQNLYMLSSTAPTKGSNWTRAIQAWFDEYKAYHYPDGPGAETGHYTQVVWADTNKLGCGYTHYPSDGWYNKLYVCNYGPAGNYVGRPPYLTEN